VRAMQRMQFRAKSAKNDLKPTNFLKYNFYFETEGVHWKRHTIQRDNTRHLISNDFISRSQDKIFEIYLQINH
jgi:hypothetical protein